MNYLRLALALAITVTAIYTYRKIRRELDLADACISYYGINKEDLFI
jgi:hypothetical protein